MDAFQDRRFAAAQPPPPPPPCGDPSFHNPPPPPPYYHPHQQQQPPFPHQEPPNYPSYHHHHLPPPPFPYQQQWHQGMPPPPQPQLPPYSQYPSHYPGPAGAPPQLSYDMLPFPPHHHHHNQYPPPPHAAAAGPPIPHTSLPPSRPHGHHHLSPSPPPQSSSAYPPVPPPNPGWGSQSWAQHQGWEYPGNYQSDSMPIGKAEEHSFALHEQNQSADHHIDTQQSSFSQSSIHHPGIYTMEQQKQANISHGPTSYPSGSTYGAEGHSQSGAGDQAKFHLSPPRNYGPTSSIYEQEVPYSYSSTPGNRLAINQGDSLPQPLSYQSQEGFTGLQSNLPERNVTSEQLIFTHDGQPFSYVSDASNKPLDFHPRTAPNLEVCPKPSHGLVAADPVGSTGLMDPNAWTPLPAVFPQSLAPSGTQFDSFASQQSLSVPHAPVFGGLAGPSFMPNMPHVNAPFGLGAEHANQVAGYPADVNGTFNISERPKKSAVPKWLQEEIIKNKSVIASHSAGSSHESLESEDAGKSYRGTDQNDQKSIDSTRSAEDDEDDDAVEAAKSAAINLEIKRILTEVLLKVTDEFFNQIATKVFDENDTVIEAITERNDQENHKVVPSVLTSKASAKALVPLKEKSNKFNSVNNSPPLGGGNILGLANYASDEEDGDDEEESGGGNKGEVNQSLKLHSSSKLQESDSGSSAVENKRLEKVDVLVGFEKKREYPNPNPQAIDIQNGGASKSLQHTSVSDESHFKNTKGLSEVVDKQKSMKSGLLNDAADKRESRKVENTGRDSTFGKSSNKGGYVGESKNTLSTSQNQGKDRNNEDTVKKKAVKDDYHGQNHENRTSLKEDNFRKTDQYRNAEQRADSEHKRYGSMERKESARDKKEKIKEDSELKKKREKMEDHATKDSVKYSSRRSPSPSNRGRIIKESSSHGRGSISSDEPPDNSKKRKLHSRRNSTSRSPTRSRARQVSRSPDRKHSHRRHSPYSSTDRRRRSRSSSPAPKRR